MSIPRSLGASWTKDETRATGGTRAWSERAPQSARKVENGFYPDHRSSGPAAGRWRRVLRVQPIWRGRRRRRSRLGVGRYCRGLDSRCAEFRPSVSDVPSVRTRSVRVRAPLPTSAPGLFRAALCAIPHRGSLDAGIAYDSDQSLPRQQREGLCERQRGGPNAHPASLPRPGTAKPPVVLSVLSSCHTDGLSAKCNFGSKSSSELIVARTSFWRRTPMSCATPWGRSE